ENVALRNTLDISGDYRHERRDYWQGHQNKPDIHRSFPRRRIMNCSPCDRFRRAESRHGWVILKFHVTMFFCRHRFGSVLFFLFVPVASSKILLRQHPDFFVLTSLMPAAPRTQPAWNFCGFTRHCSTATSFVPNSAENVKNLYTFFATFRQSALSKSPIA